MVTSTPDQGEDEDYDIPEEVENVIGEYQPLPYHQSVEFTFEIEIKLETFEIRVEIILYIYLNNEIGPLLQSNSWLA